MKHRIRPINRYFFAVGVLATLFPFFIWLALWSPFHAGFHWPRLVIAGIAGGCELACAALLLRAPRMGKAFGGIGLAGLGVLLWPFLSENPFLALLFFSGAVISVFSLMDLESFSAPAVAADRTAPERLTALGASVFVFLCSASGIFAESISMLSRYCLATSGLVALWLFGRWAWRRKRWLRRIGTGWCVAGAVIILLGVFFPHLGLLSVVTSLVSIVLLLGFRGGRYETDESQSGWDMVLHYPARILFMTFFLLCTLGALLLNLPGAAADDVGILDAAFTAVSAACVTGLTTLNSAGDFTHLGQFFILLLVQFGGIGIMTIATVVLFTIGRRLSLAQERVMTRMADSDHRDLFASLILVLRFSFIVELVGAVILALAFLYAGSEWPRALWEGVFTSVSAFCNAGFSLNDTNLIGYQDNPVILWTVALLVMFGGLAPATSVLIPRWLTGRPVPLTAHLALMTSLLLIVLGGLSFLILEWNGIFRDLTFWEKCNNACFLAISARTAGFNSVDMTSLGMPAFLMLVFQMFVGGSPGGTAGGIRTTTFAVMVLAFWSEICNRGEIIFANRRISRRIVIRAMTIATASGLIATMALLMLLVTQQIPARELVFEVFSALGTVGLSIGATPHLDGMGKIIVMLTMFIGRIGPMSLFLLLDDTRRYSSAYYPDAKVTLT